MKQPASRLSQSGMTMIELMISMVIGLLLTAAVLQVFLSSRTTYTLNTELARMQEDARFAFIYMARELRSVGYDGCMNRTGSEVANVLKGGGSSWYTNFGQALAGYDNVSSVIFGSGKAVANTDAIAMHSLDYSRQCEVDEHNPQSANLRCNNEHPFERGDILVATDCRHTAVFQMTGPNSNVPTELIVHNTGSSVSPGNCAKLLGETVNTGCSGNAGSAYTFAEHGWVMAMKSTGFFIRENSNGEPALYRASLSISNAGQASAAAKDKVDEIIPNVENMQIVYGEDLNGDGYAERYRSADQVADMQNVVSVRLTLLLRSQLDNITSTAQPYTFAGQTITPNDRRLRKSFTTTIVLRNRTH